MAPVRWVVVAVLLGTATVVQSALLPALGIRSHTAVPVFLIIVGFAQRLDFTAAISIGFAGGLLVDLTPPALGPIGMNSLLGVLAAAAIHSWNRATATDTAGLLMTLGAIVMTIAFVGIIRTLVTNIVIAHVPFGLAFSAVVCDCAYALVAAPLLLPLIETLTRGGRGSTTRLRTGGFRA